MSNIPPVEPTGFQTNTGSNITDMNIDMTNHESILEINDTLSNITSFFGETKTQIALTKEKLQDPSFQGPISELTSDEDQETLQDFLTDNFLDTTSVKEIYPTDLNIPEFKDVPQLKSIQDFPFFLHQIITYLDQNTPPIRHLINPPVWQQKEFIRNYKNKKDKTISANASTKHLSAAVDCCC